MKKIFNLPTIIVMAAILFVFITLSTGNAEEAYATPLPSVHADTDKYDAVALGSHIYIYNTRNGSLARIYNARGEKTGEFEGRNY